jgi:hypothetical protein
MFDLSHRIQNGKATDKARVLNMNNVNTGPESNELLRLRGEQLVSVIFVMDYVQFDFAGPRITAYDWPRVVNDIGTYSNGSNHYRDVLCDQIAKIVKSIDISKKLLTIEFKDDSRIEISLIVPESGWAEAAVYSDTDRNVMLVWNKKKYLRSGVPPRRICRITVPPETGPLSVKFQRSIWESTKTTPRIQLKAGCCFIKRGFLR